MKIKRLINCFIPVSVCNFECSYCYVPQCEGRKKNIMPNFRLAADEISRALSAERLGGACFMNICGDGETLIPKEVPGIIKALLREGHVIEVVTNGTLTDRFNEIFDCEPELLWENVDNARNHGCSITVELTPHDELLPLIEDIKKDCMEHVGALCHVTTAFNYQKEFELLTSLSREEYLKAWGSFNSPMFEFKMSVLGKKRCEYCYAGEFLMSVDLASGIAKQCYCGRQQNIYDSLNKPLKWNAIGKHCVYPMCFNAHALMVFGAIPELATNVHYTDMRNRICKDGSEWLQPVVKEAFESKFIESNKKYSTMKKVINEADIFAQRVVRKVRKK